MADFSKIDTKLKRLEQFMQNEAAEIIGTEAVNHFQENFEKQGFDGKKWKEVKRRKPDSPWYGFEYGEKQALPSNHPRRKEAKKAYKKRKDSPITNFSTAATKTPILSSKDSELENSIQYKVLSAKKVKVFSDLEYASVHNEGQNARVFGGKSFKMPKRQFIGKSAILQRKINEEIKREIRNIMNK